MPRPTSPQLEGTRLAHAVALAALNDPDGTDVPTALATWLTPEHEDEPTYEAQVAGHAVMALAAWLAAVADQLGVTDRVAQTIGIEARALAAGNQS